MSCFRGEVAVNRFNNKPCFFSQNVSVNLHRRWGRGQKLRGGGTLFNGLYRKAPLKRGVFFEDLGIWKGRDFTS